MLQRSNYLKYISYIKDLNFEQETATILKSIQSYYQEFPDIEEISCSELMLYNSLRNPLTKKRDTYLALFDKLNNIELNSKLVEENFNSILEKYFGSEILYKISESLEQESSGVLDDVENLIEEYKENKLKLQNEEDNFVTTSIKDIVQDRIDDPGINWRLPTLNKHLGPIRGKSLGHVFARVDTGKTSFLISEESYWISQIKDDEVIIHFNNEEDGRKLMFRFYQALLNVSKDVLLKYPERCEEEFIKRGGNKFKLFDRAVITIEDIEECLKKYKVKVITVDQADKIQFHGMNKLGDVARLQAVYSRLRELSKKYNVPILTVGQASVSAEDKKWLLTSDLDSSKTLKPGEFDYILGIGKILSDEVTAGMGIRYLHLCKNKLETGQHAQFEALIDTTRALYREPSYEELKEAYGNYSTTTHPDELSYLDN